MLLLLAPSPLQSVRMSAVQRSKRRSGLRNESENDDALPAKKKTKADHDINQGNDKPVGGRTRRIRQVYDEEVDGFAFRRRKKLKTATKEEIQPTRIELATKVLSGSISGTSLNSPDKPVARRSARLSANNDPPRSATIHHQSLETTTKRRKAIPKISNPCSTEPRATDPSPALSSSELGGTKSSKNGTRIALPLADTPVIKRNKEMRAAYSGRSSNQSRRSSAGSRGRRASSLIDSGTSNGLSCFSSSWGPAEELMRACAAIPHVDVAISDFYKLIEQGLPERKRMRHLLIWSGTRALLEKPRGAMDEQGNDAFVIESARQIQEELIEEFGANEQLSDWWSREDDPAPSRPKRANPRNIRNQDKLREIEEEIQRLEAEEKSWKELSTTRLLEPPAPKKPQASTSTSALVPINPSLLSDTQRSLLTSLNLCPTLLPSVQPQPQPQSQPHSLTSNIETVNSRLQKATSQLEPTIDTFTHGIHQLAVYTSFAGRMSDQIKAAWAEKLQCRYQDAQQASGSAGIAPRDVFRALASKLNES